MTHKYAEIVFTEQVKQLQEQYHSRHIYASLSQGPDSHYRLGPAEKAFIAERDSCYMASVNSAGWPYVQHRGGPQGFMRVLDDKTLGFADFSGNRQYVSAGNFLTNNRVSLFFMDYPKQRRLKLAGRISQVDESDTATLMKLAMDGYPAQTERAYRIQIEGFDWNCPQHITPRYSEQELQGLLLPLIKARSTSLPRLTKSLGDGPLALIITGIKQLTPEIRAYQLSPAEGQSLAPVGPGANLPVPVRLASGKDAWRTYSISSHPERTDSYEIAVKHEANGKGGSAAIHSDFQLGMTLHCQPVQRHFAKPVRSTPSVLIAGGIGITAMKPLADVLHAEHADFRLFYAGRSRALMAYLEPLQRRLGAKLEVFAGDEHQRLDLSGLFRTLPATTQVYISGPQRLVAACYRAASDANFAPENIICAYFTTPLKPPLKMDRPLLLTLAKSGKRLSVAADESVLAALHNANIPVPAGCRSGVCRACVTEILHGDAEHRDQCLTDEEKRDLGLFCPCVSRAIRGELTLNL